MGTRHTPWLSGRMGLVHADENVHAARQLRSRVPGVEWVDLATADAATDLPVVELVKDPSTRQLNGDSYRRWQYLANRLLQRKYMGQ